MLLLYTLCTKYHTSQINYSFYQSLGLEIVATLAIFVVIVIIINMNLSRLVKMRTDELIEQRDNLENLVEEKTRQGRNNN